jgi:hypothetical protein
MCGASRGVCGASRGVWGTGQWTQAVNTQPQNMDCIHFTQLLSCQLLSAKMVQAQTTLDLYTHGLSLSLNASSYLVELFCHPMLQQLCI